MSNKLPNLLTVKEVAEWLGVHPMTVYRKAIKGDIPAVKFGKSWLFPEDVLKAWIQSQVRGGPHPETNADGMSLKEKLRANAPSFASLPEIQLVYLFGSHAGETTTPMSDIDIAYLDDGSSSQFDLDAKLEGVVLETVPDAARIDLVRLGNAPVVVQYRVIRDGRLIYNSSEDALTAFEEGVINRYLDYSTVLDHFYSDAYESLKEVS